jgi:hypothetical protein
VSTVNLDVLKDVHNTKHVKSNYHINYLLFIKPGHCLGDSFCCARVRYNDVIFYYFYLGGLGITIRMNATSSEKIHAKIWPKMTLTVAVLQPQDAKTGTLKPRPL